MWKDKLDNILYAYSDTQFYQLAEFVEPGSFIWR